ncbi:hypothetical protein Vadar_009180 [Vaccinium darrowii]|uniref:Uncharacterized protein n=1 Tax=Vaccinium darrowii TaxID=229202 RepID=A0ACB7WYY6_9ERIC|nr:hypothetical protein Vadar_009180 [Vaccinium darrowii]
MENTQFCYYGRIGKLNCSWMDSNLGRRFISCECYGKLGACGYFLWVDPPLCQRAMVVISGLIRSLARQEALVKKEKRKVACFVGCIDH